ncbi:mechanosensitive ion channel family protein [Pseudomonas syringae pv. tagetis]|uniref:Mechanosensitive ion channel family protein n=2 Tax=Pseudomonas syringae group genomosp. 7 TaxID=251699 RepID=A0A0Q0AZ08_9PSED|nr:mechanosensitive ion channel family protein [Pseudomonas syringae group genomosp. 7]KPX47424.1 MscS mechanosensitive ion channel [Pseudomonas syringae pv. helianthi]KPY84809.1 Small-conductance mechanosensitive channel family protein [Pseudomonas syringae pv. tagetis]RMR02892.1 Small-conductance mechanosensitive channel protein [Pseudomonas syringae pv. helianthi]RMW10019.1 Small-conductance mechanosensitive channel protein [Pseudomonas syringae pv. tagetis]RMW22527.1 Small-conductance mech
MEQDIIRFFTDSQFLGISLANWILAIVASTLSFILVRGVIGFVLRKMRSRADAPTTHMRYIVVQVLSGTSNTLLLLASILIGVGMLDLPDRWLGRVSSLWFVVAALQVGLWANRAIALALQRYFIRHNANGTFQGSALATLSLWGAKVLLWATVVMAMLSNVGVNITAFVASLGVGGIAVALAVQNILGDVFASLSIAVDKPFEVGDFIVVGALSGTVEHVGLKTTRIRSLGGEQIVMANADMINNTIQNYKRLQERRIVFEFRLTYDCSVDQIREVPKKVEAIINAQELARFDRSHFRGFGETSLEFETVFIVLDPSYNVYMDVQQAINLKIMEAFAELDVRFAFPSRTVYVASLPPVKTSRPTALEAADAST